MLALNNVPEQRAQYEFTNTWFAPHERAWADLFASLKPQRILEIGCYEGRATVFMIQEGSRYADLQVTCVDTWAGSIDLPPEAMAGVEGCFDRNTAIAIGACTRPVTFHKRKQSSIVALAELITNGKRFDLIYVDGSHTAPDVLTDAVMAFHLLAPGGVMVFDDYTWCMEPQGKQDPLNMPKFAIETFATVFMRKLMVTPFGAGHGQYAVRKVSE